MSGVNELLLEQELHLPAGASEVEILVFQVGDYSFGIQAAKVRNVLPRGPLVPLPHPHASVLGTVAMGAATVPVLSLRRHLQVGDGDTSSDRTLLVADMAGRTAALVIDNVERIYRQAVDQLLAIPAIRALTHSPVSALARLDDRLVILLDYEAIGECLRDLPLPAAGFVAPPLLEPARRESLERWLKPAKTPLAEQAPTWDIEGDDGGEQANPRVWQTYRAELADRSRHLARLLERSRKAPADAATYQEVLRTLHTIKSASLVVPVPEATRLTQLVESQLGATRLAAAPWPLETLELYADWLQELAAPGSPLAEVLARGRTLHERLLAAR